jgi:perosamine synthetase
MRKINNNTMSFCLVEKNQKILSIITDGDIRRYITQGGSLKDKVLIASNKKFYFLNKEKIIKNNFNIKNYFKNQIKYIPVLDEQKKLFKIFFKGSSISTSLVEPYFKGNEHKYLSDCIKTNWISSQGKYVTKFEDKFKEIFKTKNNLTTTNGTNALHLILSTLGIGKGDEVLVPDYTFIGSVNPIIYNNAMPKLIDIDKNFGIDPEKIKENLNKNVKAIIVVHLFGVPANINEIKKIAQKNKIFLIEDCAEAIGSYVNNVHVGNFGDAAMFSFFGNKTITTGEGGMACFKQKKHFNKAKLLRGHGMSEKKRYWHDIIGYNYRMTNIQAAIGLAQLENYKNIIKKKIDLSKIYNKILKKNNFIELLPILKNQINSYWFYVIQIRDTKKFKTSNLIKYLKNQGVEARRSFYPIHRMDKYKRYATKNINISVKKSNSCILLPCWPNMKKNEVKFISNKINSYFF